MSLLSLRQSLIDTFELRVLLDLGDGAVERRAVAFVLPVSHVLGHFIGVSHPSPPIMCGSGPLLLPPNQPSAAEPRPKLGISRAKAQRPQSDGPRPVIPSECEGSKKDFSFGRNDKARRLARADPRFG